MGSDNQKISIGITKDLFYRMALEAHEHGVTLEAYIVRTLQRRERNGEEDLPEGGLQDAHGGEESS